MINPNAARHLALVVAVLLCFFGYMGYRLAERQGDAGTETAPLMPDMTGLTPPASDRPGQTAPLMTVEDAQGLPAHTDSPGVVIDTPPSMPTAITGQNSESAPGDDTVLGGAVQDAPAAPSGGLTPPPSPSGSIEESHGPITGLIADSEQPPSAPPSPPAQTPPAFPPTDRPATDSGPPSAPPGPPLHDTTESAGLLPSAGGAGISPPSGRPPVPESRNEPAVSRNENATAVDMPGIPPPPMPPNKPDDRPSVPPVASNADTPPPRPQAVPGRRSDDTSDLGFNPEQEMVFGDSVRLYIIRPGDTLSRIAARELGSISLADNIFLLNRDIIVNPDQLTVGERIRLPVKKPAPASETRAAGPTAPAAPDVAAGPAGAVAPPAGQTGTGTDSALNPTALPKGWRIYRIRPGDTLSSISLHFYGSSAGWQFLHQANRDVLPNPNQLVVGTELKIPPYETMR